MTTNEHIARIRAMMHDATNTSTRKIGGRPVAEISAETHALCHKLRDFMHTLPDDTSSIALYAALGSTLCDVIVGLAQSIDSANDLAKTAIEAIESTVAVSSKKKFERS